MIYSNFTATHDSEDTEEISIKPVAFPCSVKPVYSDTLFFKQPNRLSHYLYKCIVFIKLTSYVPDIVVSMTIIM